MEFTQKEYKALCDTFLNDEAIIITGCNFIAQEFETTGKLAQIKAGELFPDAENPDLDAIGVTNDTIIVEFEKKEEGKLRTPYSASFVTDLYADDPHNLVIKDIKLKKSKKVIYTNKDYEDHYTFFRESLIEYDKQLLRNNITPACMNTTCQNLTNYIGRPINVNGETGVLYLVDSYCKGQILIYLLDFKDLLEIKIPATSKIEIGKTLIKIDKTEKHVTFDEFLMGFKGRKKW